MKFAVLEAAVVMSIFSKFAVIMSISVVDVLWEVGVVVWISDWEFLPGHEEVKVILMLSFFIISTSAAVKKGTVIFSYNVR